MDADALRALLERVRAGETGVDAAVESLRRLPYEDLGYARVDHHRAIRTGFPEVVYCPGKTPEQVVGILGRLTPNARTVLATRADADTVNAVMELWPDAEHHPLARMIVVGEPEGRPERPVRGTVLVVSAGTADLPAAEECAVTLRAMGSPVERLYDVGVAGLHRLLDAHEQLITANVVVVVAGMEGALASVVGGLVSRPVIAVPTSVGYGANFGGLSALLTMLNSCATGIGVVNIDNGFGAACLAHLCNT